MALYSSLCSNLRGQLWLKLVETESKIFAPWLGASDFNDIKELYDKKGDDSFNWHQAFMFNDHINACNILELESLGGRFTWKGPEILSHK